MSLLRSLLWTFTNKDKFRSQLADGKGICSSLEAIGVSGWLVLGPWHKVHSSTCFLNSKTAVLNQYPEDVLYSSIFEFWATFLKWNWKDIWRHARLLYQPKAVCHHRCWHAPLRLCCDSHIWDSPLHWLCGGCQVVQWCQYHCLQLQCHCSQD